MLIPSLKTQLLERACLKLLEQGNGFRLVREQIKMRFPIPANPDSAVVDAVIDPVRREPRGPSDLRYRQVAGYAARMGLPAFAEQPMTQPQDANRAGQDGGVLG